MCFAPQPQYDFLDAVSCKLQHLYNQLCLSVGLSVCLSPLCLPSPDWSEFGYPPPDWSILRMRTAQVMPKIDLIVTADLPTAKMPHFMRKTLAESLGLSALRYK